MATSGAKGDHEDAWKIEERRRRNREAAGRSRMAKQQRVIDLTEEYNFWQSKNSAIKRGIDSVKQKSDELIRENKELNAEKSMLMQRLQEAEFQAFLCELPNPFD